MDAHRRGRGSVSGRPSCRVLRYEPRIRGARNTAWVVGAVWLLTLVNLVAFWSVARERPGMFVGTSVYWGVFALIAVRAARRREELACLHAEFRAALPTGTRKRDRR